MNKVIALFKRFFSGIGEIPLNYREFGFKVSIWMLIGKTYPPLKRKRFISAIYKYIETEMVPSFPQWISEYKGNTTVKMEFIPIWFCWLQGENQLGAMGKICLYQLRKFAPHNSKVVVLDYNNIHNYVDIPEYIWKKHKESLIGGAHFSDVLRFSLLSKYGGLWVDSTIYTTKQIDDNIVNKLFFSCKLQRETCLREPSQGFWTGFLIGGKTSIPLFYLVRQCLFKYWEEHDRVIEYNFFDYFLMCVYKHDEEFKRIIDLTPINNSSIWELWDSINKEYSDKLFNDLMKAQTFYKTSHHVLAEETVNSKLTIWGKILENYNANNQNNDTI